MLGDFVLIEREGGVFMAEEAGLGLDTVLVFGEEGVMGVWVVGVEFCVVGREEVGVGFYGVAAFFEEGHSILHVMGFISK